MSVLSTLVVKLIGDVSDFENKMNGAASKLASVGQSMTKTGQAMTAGITLPLVAAGGAAIHFANKFNEGMANVASLGEEAAAKVGEWKPLIQDIAIATGKSTDDMAAGLYQVVSAFGVADDTIRVLDINARAAAAGLATTTDAINLTSAVTKAYGDTSAEAVQQVADLALTAVQLGQTTFPELAASIGRVTPLANQLNVSQQELFATMATATGVTGSAAEVSTQLRGVLQSLMSPTGAMIQLQKELGFETGAAMIEQLGLHGSIIAITKAAEENNVPLQKFIGSIEGQTLALVLSGSQAETYAEKLKAMEHAAGATDAAFAAQTGGINATGFAMQQAKIQMMVWTQQVGDQLLPIVAQLLETARPLVDWITNMIAGFAAMEPKTQGVILGIVGLVAAIGPFLVIAGQVVTAVGAIIGVLGAPVLLVIAAVVAAVAALALAWSTNFGGIREKTFAFIEWVRPYIQAGMQAVAQFFAAAWETIKRVVEIGAAFIKRIIEIYMLAEQGQWYEFGAALRRLIDDIWERIKEIFTNAKERIIVIVGDLITSIRAWFTDTDWGEVARAIVTGIANGILSGASAIADAARNAARAALDAAKGFLGIQSPSRAFIEIGHNIGGGLVRGIGDTENDIATAIERVTSIPDVRSNMATNYNFQIDARGGELGIEDRITRAVKIALREMGVDADSRRRVNYAAT